MTATYNEFDAYPAEWLRNLIAAGHIADGVVDERSIVELAPRDLRERPQFHAFAGIGVWSHALRRAGVPDDFPVWTGSCPCFPAGTLILTRRGQVPIEEVLVDDEVLTHRARWRRVSHIGSDRKACVTVKGQGHWGLTCTQNHPFLVGDDAWARADALVGRTWATVAEVPPAEIPPIAFDRGVFYDKSVGRFRVKGERNGEAVYIGLADTREAALALRQQAIRDGRIDVRGADAVDPTTLGFARFLGYWLGDGWTSGESLFICGARGDAALLEGLMADAAMPTTAYLERTSSRARCGSQALVAWLREHFGTTAHNKRIPAWLHGASAEYRAAFLSGYKLADGCTLAPGPTGRNPTQSFSTVSRALAVGVRMLLNQAGISASIIRTHARGGSTIIEGRTVNERPMYRVVAYERARSFKFKGVHGWGKVRRCVPAEETTVYNLAVDDDESYCADGIAVHNCQPFSSAGQRRGLADERHLWPTWFALIDQCRPPIVFGEQVASKDGLAWLDAVHDDLEGAGYSVGAFDLPACSAGAPHLRQRLYFVAVAGGGARERLRVPLKRWRAGRLADATGDGRQERSAARLHDHGQGWHDAPRRGATRASGPAATRATGDAGVDGARQYHRELHGDEGQHEVRAPDSDHTSVAAGAARSATGGLGDAERARLEGGRARGPAIDADGARGPANGFWANAVWLPCRDGKSRAVEPGTFPLVDGSPTRVGQVRAYGNAIVAEEAAGFIEDALETLCDTLA